MRVYVDGKERWLKLVDRESGKDYAKSIVCSQERLETDSFSDFTMTDEEFTEWEKVLGLFQEAEDISFSLKDIVNPQELDNYIYEETKYLTDVRGTAEMEKIVLGELKKAVDGKNIPWLTENNFLKTIKKLK